MRGYRREQDSDDSTSVNDTLNATNKAYILIYRLQVMPSTVVCSRAFTLKYMGRIYNTDPSTSSVDEIFVYILSYTKTLPRILDEYFIWKYFADLLIMEEKMDTNIRRYFYWNVKM